MVDREVLHGGIANAGAVIREGEHVLRPANPHTELIHAFLRHVRASGFDGVPEPVGIEGEQERLAFIAGDVPRPPYPAWSQTDEALASVARLLARFHEAGKGFAAPESSAWSAELADPAGGQLICHNDVCLENVVFRDGVAVALLDFDFAAPGRPHYDLAAMARMCIPLDLVADADRIGWTSFDPFERLRVVADSYGLPPGRADFLGIIEQSMLRGAEFVRNRVERGEPAFVLMWQWMDGQARYDRRFDWFRENRELFLDAVG